MFLLALMEVSAHPPAAPAPAPPPWDTPHLACASPFRVHVTSRPGEVNYCGSSTASRTGEVNNCGSSKVGGSAAPGNFGRAARGPPARTCGDRQRTPLPFCEGDGSKLMPN